MEEAEVNFIFSILIQTLMEQRCVLLTTFELDLVKSLGARALMIHLKWI